MRLPAPSSARVLERGRSGREGTCAAHRLGFEPSRDQSGPGAGHVRARAPPVARDGGRADARLQSVAGAQGAVRDAAAARRVALGTYLPSLSVISSAGWSDQTLGTAGLTPGLASTSANTYGAGLVGALDVFTGGRRGAQRSYSEAISQAADAGLVQQRYTTILLAKQGYFDVLRAHELVRVALEFVAQAELGLGYARD